MRPISQPQQVARKQLAQRVRELRSQRGFTQEALAQRAGLAVRHLQKLESSSLNVTLDTLSRVAKALDVEVKDLFSQGSANESNL